MQTRSRRRVWSWIESCRYSSANSETKRIWQWFVGYTVQESPTLRRIAVLLLIRHNRKPPPMSAFATHSDRQVLGFFHLVIGHAAPGRFWILALCRLPLVRPHLLSDVTAMLLDEAIVRYPRICGNALAVVWQSERTSDLDTDSKEALDQARERILSRLDELQSQHQTKSVIPELVTLRPALAVWNQTAQQAFARAQEDLWRSGHYPVLSMATRVPIARGEGMAHGQEPERVTRFSEYSTTIEVAIRDAVDPLAGVLSRQAHLQRARELLQPVAEESED